MRNAFLIVVRFLDGRFHGRDLQKAKEWPPAPARLFQALIAGSARGATISDSHRNALDWLESLDPPTISAPLAESAQSYKIYVPNNDLDATLTPKRTWDEAVAQTRVDKLVQPMLFDPNVPVTYYWLHEDTLFERMEALRDLAKGLYQLGRGTDAAWAEAIACSADEARKTLQTPGTLVYHPSRNRRGTGGSVLSCPASGLRQGLQQQYRESLTRFDATTLDDKPIGVFRQSFKPAWALRQTSYNAKPQRFVFDLRNVNEGDAFSAKHLRSTAQLVQQLRDKAAGDLVEAMPEQRQHVERYLVGRGANEQDKANRVQIVPIPSVGHEHADMMIRRVSVYVPQSCPISHEDLSWAFSQVVWFDNNGVITAELERTDETRMADRFETSTRHWQSVTPLALSVSGRGPREVVEARAAKAFQQALRHANVQARILEIRVQREPFQSHGCLAEAFAAGTRFPQHLLWHVDAVFDEPVSGPLVLGNGRFLGLGLMQPVSEFPEVLAFSIVDGLLKGASAAEVVSAARRAMIARVQEHLGRGKEVSEYVSGHQPNGAPARDGGHRHVAVVADLARKRILFLAPTLLARQGIQWRKIAQEHRGLAQALEGMTTLRAGPAGLLRLAPIIINTHTDPLFVASRVWESVTEYRVTRHLRRVGDEEALISDAMLELNRRGWPRVSPNNIEVLSSRRGRNRDLSGRLRITFPSAQPGPMVIGRSSHKGGGCFAGTNC